MRKVIFSKPLVPFSMLAVALVAALVTYSTCSFAESKNPERGSVVFGSEKKTVSSKAAQINEVRSVFADIAEEVVPTVVQVIPTKIDTVTFSNNPFYQFFGNSPFGFDDFFGGSPHQRQPQVEKREYRQQGLGSGVIVSKDGYILTNHHVVKGADEIEVKTSDNRSFQADVVGMDSLSDVAVLKIKNDVKDLPVAYLGDSDKLRPGDWALAIGNPFSLSSSVTMGIISALGRTAGNDANSYQNFIQTDAAINPGNSGGALVNIDGELIGINTMIYTKSGGNMGIGFAIPINMAKKIMEDLIYEGKVNRGWLGVMIQELDYNTRDALGINNKTQGVLIGDVFKNQPADKAGIKRGDIVLSINNKTVGNTNELRNVVAGISPGKKVPVVVLRNNKKVTLSVLLTGRDESQVNQSADTESKDNTSENASDFSKLLGIKAGNITPELQSQLDLDKNVKGVVILGVEQGSQAQREGLAQNDIVLEINRQATPSIKEFKKVSGTIKAGDSVLFLIQRDGSTFFKAFKVKK